MARRIRYDDDAAPGSPGVVQSAIRTVRRLITTLAILAIMLYAAVLALSRSNGFRSYVETGLSEALGVEVSLIRVYITPGLELVMEDAVAGHPDQPGAAGAKAGRIVVNGSPWRPAGRRIRSVSVENGSLSLAPDASGAWAPAAVSAPIEALIHGAGLDLQDMRPSKGGAEAGGTIPPVSIAAPRAAVSPVPHLRLKGVSIVWWKADRTRLAAIEQLDAELTPVDLPGRVMTHLRMEAGAFNGPGGEWISPFRAECLWGGDQRIVLDAALGAPRPAPPPAAGP